MGRFGIERNNRRRNWREKTAATVAAAVAATAATIAATAAVAAKLIFQNCFQFFQFFKIKKSICSNILEKSAIPLRQNKKISDYSAVKRCLSRAPRPVCAAQARVALVHTYRGQASCRQRIVYSFFRFLWLAVPSTSSEQRTTSRTTAIFPSQSPLLLKRFFRPPDNLPWRLVFVIIGECAYICSCGACFHIFSFIPCHDGA